MSGAAPSAPGPAAVVVGAGAAAAGVTALVTAGTGSMAIGLLAAALAAAIVGGLPWLATTGPFRLLLLVAVVTAGWDGIRIGPAGTADLLFPLSMVGCIAAAWLRREPLPWLPRPAVVAAALVGLAVVLCAVAPPSVTYLSTRVNPVTGVLAASTSDMPTADLDGVVRLVMVLLVVPAVIVWMARTPRTAELVAHAFCLGIAVSALLAVTDAVGVTHVGLQLRGFVDQGGRQSGLTAHANHLALTAAMAAPFALRAFRTPAVRAGLFGLLATAVWLSGSRAGLIGLAVALIAHIALGRMRRVLVLVVPLAAVVVAGSGLIDRTRFSGGVADGSDMFRTIAAHQGIADFEQSPVYGIGAHAVQDAHNIYLQALAALGLLGGLAFVLVVGATGWAAWLHRTDRLAVTSAMSVVVFLVIGYATNEIVSRYVAIPFALVAAVARYRSARSAAPVPRPTTAPVPSP